MKSRELRILKQNLISYYEQNIPISTLVAQNHENLTFQKSPNFPNIFTYLSISGITIYMFQKRFIYIYSCLDVSHLLTAFVPFLKKLGFFSGIFSMKNRIGFMVSQLQSLQFQELFQRDWLSLSRNTAVCLLLRINPNF
jgi:hypothetical protein